MLNQQYYEQDWIAQEPASRPYMDSNRWLANVCTTQSQRRRPAAESETFELLGLKLVWTKDGRGFPTPVIDALQKLLEFAELQPGWNSYASRPLERAAGRSVIQLIVRAHQLAAFPRMFPLSDGGVGLTWEGDAELELLVAGDGSLEGLLTIGDDEEGLAPGSTLESGLGLFDRYLAAR